MADFREVVFYRKTDDRGTRILTVSPRPGAPETDGVQRRTD